MRVPCLAAAATLAAAISCPAAADGPTVEYTCDTANGRIVVEYFDDAKRIKPNSPTQFRPSTMIRIDPKNENRVASVITVRRNCRLADGIYTFALSGAPNNFNLQGRCGAEISGRVVIVLKGRPIVNERLDGDCHREDPIITKITVNSGKAPEIERTPKDKF